METRSQSGEGSSGEAVEEGHDGTTDDEELIEACPNPDCESSRIHRMVPTKSQGRPNGKKWICHDCSYKFDEPAIRKRRHPDQIPTHGLARKLAKRNDTNG